jgi:dipeptidyl aminopeptidase/acylaminoacyl peptidase
MSIDNQKEVNLMKKLIGIGALGPKVKDAFVAFVLIFTISSQAGGQNPSKGEKVTRANYELASKFSQENMKQYLFDLNVVPNWIDHGDLFWYRWSTSAEVDFYLVDPTTKTVGKAFDNTLVASELSKALGKQIDPAHLPIDSLTFTGGLKAVQFQTEGNVYEFDRTSHALRKIGPAVSDPLLSPAYIDYYKSTTGGGIPKGSMLTSPDGRWAVFVRNHNLFLVDEMDSAHKETQLSTDGERYHSFNAWDPGNTDATTVTLPFLVWLPNSNKFFVVRHDSRKVKELWTIQPLTPRPTLRTFKYAMAGDEDVVQDELWVFDCEKKSATKVKAERWKDQKIGGKALDGGVYTTAASDKIYFIRTDRGYKQVDLCEVNTDTGDVKVIIHEESKTNVTPTSEQARIISQGKEIVWWSDLDGWGHYYLYDDQGHLKNKITSGTFNSKTILRIDSSTRTMIFTAQGKQEGVNPYYEQVYSVGLDGKGLRLLTPDAADHSSEYLGDPSLTISGTGRYFLDNFSRVDLAPQAVIRDAAGNKIVDLPPPDVSRLKGSGWKPPETFRVKAADKTTDLYGVMWKPFDFDLTKKYPVIMVTYPGPISEVVPRDFDPVGSLVTGMSQLGFVVVWFGNRGGSSERGRAYSDYSYGNMRDFSLTDKRAGLEELGAMYPFIDMDRIGVFGGSGGGFQSTTLMFTYPDFFKVCVSWAGNHDNNIFEDYWGELNQGIEAVRENGNTKFAFHAPTNQELAKNLKGHYLIMQGLQDTRVPQSITYRVIQALIEADKPFDMYIIPDEGHQFSKGKYQSYLLRVIGQYFAQNLMGDPRSKVEVWEQFGGAPRNSP